MLESMIFFGIWHFFSSNTSGQVDAKKKDFGEPPLENKPVENKAIFMKPSTATMIWSRAIYSCVNKCFQVHQLWLTAG